jgi:hypothetical protein
MVQKHVAFAPANKWGQAPFLQNNRKWGLSPSELRSRREEWNLNGVKNLLGATPFPNTPSE